MHVAQEHDVRLAVRLRQLGSKALEDVQVGKERLAVVQVVAVLTAPAERLAARALEALQVDAATAEYLQLLLAKVFADDLNQVHARE